MIKPLRKRHFQIWIVLAFSLPVGIVAGTVARHGLNLFGAAKCEKPAKAAASPTPNPKHQIPNSQP